MVSFFKAPYKYESIKTSSEIKRIDSKKKYKVKVRFSPVSLCTRNIRRIFFSFCGRLTNCHCIITDSYLKPEASII